MKRYIKLWLTRADFSRRIIVLILLLFLVLYFFISSKIIWIIYSLFLILLLAARKKFSYQPAGNLLLLIIPLLWSIILSYNDTLYQIVQGIFYLTIPIIMIIIGYQLYKVFTISQLLTSILIIGTLISLLFIIVALARVGIEAFLSPFTKVRFLLASGTPLSVMSLIISIYSGKFKLDIIKNPLIRVFLILVNLLAVYLFASRTYWVMLIVFVLIFNFRTMSLKNFLLFFTFIIVLLVAVVFTIDSTRGLSYYNSLLYKLVNSFSEIRIGGLDTFKDINIHFRGYESYRSIMTYLEGNPFELVFGQGVGKMIDLEIEIFLYESEWREIPYTHNGFLFILVKQGALGLLGLISFFFLLIRSGFKNFRNTSTDIQFLGVFLLASGISLFITTIVVIGIFNLEMSILLITIGYCIKGLYHQNSSDYA